MHRDMALPLTGNADRDVAVAMIPHHQGAIDIAQIALDHGSDPEIRKPAQAVIQAQEVEISQPREWLARHDGRAHGNLVDPVSVLLLTKPCREASMSRGSPRLMAAVLAMSLAVVSMSEALAQAADTTQEAPLATEPMPSEGPGQAAVGSAVTGSTEPDDAATPPIVPPSQAQPEIKPTEGELPD